MLVASFVIAMANPLLEVSVSTGVIDGFSSFVFIFPDPVHLHSLILKIYRRHLLISFKNPCGFASDIYGSEFHIPILLAILEFASVSFCV